MAQSSKTISENLSCVRKAKLAVCLLEIGFFLCALVASIVSLTAKNAMKRDFVYFGILLVCSLFQLPASFFLLIGTFRHNNKYEMSWYITSVLVIISFGGLLYISLYEAMYFVAVCFLLAIGLLTIDLILISTLSRHIQNLEQKSNDLNSSDELINVELETMSTTLKWQPNILKS